MTLEYEKLENALAEFSGLSVENSGANSTNDKTDSKINALTKRESELKAELEKVQREKLELIINHTGQDAFEVAGQE